MHLIFGEVCIDFYSFLHIAIAQRKHCKVEKEAVEVNFFEDKINKELEYEINNDKAENNWIKFAAHNNIAVSETIVWIANN